ncbi:MAG TPA: response regulator transcription factor [Ktedonobacteraceae bacterium]|jgi:DNA-binding response OmpR family regulator|nr:response regulator transcription factor [Ktedonobacteraceae bacterium]
MYETRKRILVVEDERAIQQVLCFFLEHSGFEVCGAWGGQDAIRIIPEFLPDLIVLDLMMRPVSGWDVLEWLHAQSFSPTIPVLVLSALVNLKHQMNGFEQGAIEYITKPTQPSKIVERVRVLLAMSTEQRLMLQHKRLDEQRKTLERLHAAQSDEFVY